MLINKIKMILIPAVTCAILLTSNNISSAEQSQSSIPYKPIELSKISRYFEDRIVFQHVQFPGFSRNEDNSIASLLVVKNNEAFLFRDGYDDPKKVAFEAYFQDIKREKLTDLWENKIDSKPDYIRIASKRIEKFLNSNKDYTEKTSGDEYRNIRNSFISYHISVFKQLMMNRVDSEFNLQRNPIFPPAFKELNATAQFSTTITARALNDYIYYAGDKDGDEVTETFYVTMKDSFNWGYKSGPNIIFIYNNNEEDIKKLIGNLCHDAYFGTSEEEASLAKMIPNEKEILQTFNLDKVKVQLAPRTQSEQPRQTTTQTQPQQQKQTAPAAPAKK